MMPPRLGPLKRFKKLGEWLNQLWDHVYSITPVASHNVRVNRTTRGTSYTGVAKGEEVSPGNFRGEWIPQAYTAGDMAKVSNGPEAGTYVAINNTPAPPPPPAIIPGDWPYYPWAGSSWVLIGRVNDQSSWL